MRKKLIFHGIVISIIVLIAIAPVLSVIAAGTIANSLGCDLDEGSVHPCDFNGRDIGLELLTMAMMGWLGIATIPLGGMAVLVYLLIVLIVEVVRYVLSQRRAAKAP